MVLFLDTPEIKKKSNSSQTSAIQIIYVKPE